MKNTTDTVSLAKAIEDMRGGFGPAPRAGWIAALDESGKVRMTAGKAAHGLLRMNASAQGWRVVRITK